MERKRVPGYITQTVSDNFGLDVKVQRQVFPKSEFYPSGHPIPEGETGLATGPLPTSYREVIPPGQFGSAEGDDVSTLGPPQFIDTVEGYPGEQANPELHGSVNVQKVANPKAPGIPFQSYASFQPRSAPIPRASQDEGYLGPPATMSADPVMVDYDSSKIIGPRDIHNVNLMDHNRTGVVKK